MKVLVVYCHPNPKSFCHAILETSLKTLRERGHEPEVRDLYAMGFQPVLKAEDFVALGAGKALPDVKKEQDLVRASDASLFIYPIWWAGLPAMVKGYIDRVYAHGFAYAIGPGGVKGLLADKKAVILNTQGAGEGVYDSTGMTDAIGKLVDGGIFGFCGIRVLEHKIFAGVTSVSDAVRKSYLEKTASILSERF